MIHTLTLNPSIDYLVEVNKLKLGETNYAAREKMLPGGKGINVSRVLNQLNVPNTALGFIGGTNGQFIKEWLENEGIQTNFSEISGNTRINVKLKAKIETEINGTGPLIDQDKINDLFQKIAELNAGDTIVLAGSKARGLAETFYQEITKFCSEKNIECVIDTNSPELIDILPFKPLLVKPNRTELGTIFDTQIQTKAEAIKYGVELQTRGAQNVIVSLGSSGAAFIDEKQILLAEAPTGKAINTVGAGDSMVAGFLAGLSHGLSNQEAFALSVQAGSATAFNEDLAKKEDIERLSDEVKIQKTNR